MDTEPASQRLSLLAVPEVAVASACLDWYQSVIFSSASTHNGSSPFLPIILGFVSLMA